MLENIRLAIVGGVLAHKMRSFLTMVGVAIGIAALILIVAINKGANDEIKRALIGSGNNTIKVTLSAGGYEYNISEYSPAPKGIPQVSDATMDKILELEEVEAATAYNSRYVNEGIFYLNTALSNIFIYGISDSYFTTCDYVVKTGRGFIPDDYAKHRKVIIMDQKAASSLFRNVNPIGKVVEISSQPFTVIGIVEERSKYEPVINSIEDYYNNQDDSNGNAFIPKGSWPIVYNFDEPENVIVKAINTDAMNQAGRKTAGILNDTFSTSSATDDMGQSVKYSVPNLQQRAANLQQLESTSSTTLIWIAIISLLSGGLGVANIMLVSVTERIGEIGLKKAIGARNSTIMVQFLTEAVVLSGLGGILGLATGFGLVYIVHRMMGTPVSVDIPMSLGALAVSMVVGIISGMFPAQRAARMDPIEALGR